MVTRGGFEPPRAGHSGWLAGIYHASRPPSWAGLEYLANMFLIY